MNAVDVILSRLDRPKKYGKGYRARCPSCGGTRRDGLAVSESDDGRVLLKCFGGCSALDVVAALGLTLADLFPAPINVEGSPGVDPRRQFAARAAMWGAALSTLDSESKVILFAGRKLQTGRKLDAADAERLLLAVTRVSDARDVLCAAAHWRPANDKRELQA